MAFSELSAGSSASFTIGELDYVRIVSNAGSGSLSIQLDGQAATTTLFGPGVYRTTIGGYGVKTNVILTCTVGTVKYDRPAIAGVASSAGFPTLSTIDASGAVVETPVQPLQKYRTRGVPISYMNGARGETVLAETVPASGGTNAASATGKFATTYRIRCATDATNGTVRINAPTGKTWRMTSNDSLLVLMYIEACNSADTLVVTISNDGMVNGSSATIALNANKAPGYWWQVIDAAAFSGTVTLPSNLNSLRAKITRSGATATAVHICGIIQNASSKPCIIIDFDDAFRSLYTNAFRVMSSYGLIGNVAVIQRVVGQSAGGVDTFDYCTLPELQDMLSAGWGMATHGYWAHNGAPLNSYATIAADVDKNLNYVKANLPSTSNLHYVLPAGQFHSTTDQVLTERGFRTCRGTIGEQTSEIPQGLDNSYRLFGNPISASAGLANIKAKFDTAKKLGTTVRFQGHRVLGTVTDSANEILDTDFEAFCAYIAPSIASGEVENLTLGEWYSRRIA